MAKFNVTFTRTTTATYEKSFVAKDWETADSKANEWKDEQTEKLDAELDKVESETEYEIEVQEE